MAQTNAKVNCLSENYDSSHNNCQDKQSSFLQNRAKNVNYSQDMGHNVPFDEYLLTSKYDTVESGRHERIKDHSIKCYSSFPSNFFAPNSAQYTAKHNPMAFEKLPACNFSQNFTYDSSTGISNATSQVENSNGNFHPQILNQSDAYDCKKNYRCEPSLRHRYNGQCDGALFDFHNGCMTEENFVPRSTNDTYENLKNIFIDQYDIKQRKQHFDQAQTQNKYSREDSFDIFETMPEVVKHLSLISQAENSRGKSNKRGTTVPLSSISVPKQNDAGGAEYGQMRDSIKRATYKNSLKLIKPPVSRLNNGAADDVGECNGSDKNGSTKSDSLALDSTYINRDHSDSGKCPKSKQIKNMCQKEPTDTNCNCSDISAKRELNSKIKDALSKSHVITANQKSSFREYDNFPIFHRDLNDLASLERSKCNVLSVIDNGLHRIEQCRSGANLSTSKSKKTTLSDCGSESLQTNAKKAAVAYSSDTIQSDFISNMFKEYRCYHLENMKQEIKRIQYLDNLPDRWLNKKIST